jgi:putative transposase
LWQKSYHDHVIRDENQLLAAVRYMERNPVEDGLVDLPEQYPYSSAAIDLKSDYDAWLR